MTIEHELQGVIAGGIEVKMPRYSQIDGRLWVGGQPMVAAPHQFSFIINLNPSMPYHLHRHQVQVCHLMYDERNLPDAKACGWVVKIALGFLKAGPTLIHCREGLNRSPFMAGLVLIELGMTPAAAVQMLKAKRHAAIFSNDTYEKQLLSLDKEKVKWNE